jgi:hypothetical protein
LGSLTYLERIFFFFKKPKSIKLRQKNLQKSQSKKNQRKIKEKSVNHALH